MLVHPDIAALRSDDAPQRQAQAALGAALERWQSTPLVRNAQAELEQFGKGLPIEDLPLLSALFAEGNGADSFVGQLVDTILTELARDPLGQSPLRHYCDDTIASITVLRHGTTVLSLQAIDGYALGRGAVPSSVRFVPCETWEKVLAGSAAAERVTIAAGRSGGVDFERTYAELSPGQVRHRNGQVEAQLLRRVPTTLVTLKLQRRSACSDVTREYALEDGALLHQAAGSPRDSRLELTAALLGRMGRRDAAPLLAAMSEERGNASLRWQVLRECLALDTAQGFAALSRIACDSADPLAAHASALRAQLVETYPQLSGIEPCPVS